MDDNQREVGAEFSSDFKPISKKNVYYHLDTRGYFGGGSRDPYHQRYRMNTLLRFGMAYWACVVVSVWLWRVSGLVANKDNGLSDSVLIVLLTTTTFNILGLTYIILKGLFKDDERIDERKDER